MRRILISALLFISSAASSIAIAEGGNHHQAYLESIQLVMDSPKRLVDEMLGISHGRVAHFDFLQHEHIELLRHTSALRHPPINMAEADRNNIISRADILYRKAQSLELVIADFLQEEALLSSASSNALDILTSWQQDQISTEELESIRNLQQVIGLLKSDGRQQGLQAIEQATATLSASSVEQNGVNELLVQLELIKRNSAEPSREISKIHQSDIEPLAAQLQAAYQASLQVSR